MQCRALYAVLLHPEVARSGKSPMFLSLLFKAMKADVSTKRVAAFVKRLLQIAQEQQPAFTCGCLLMVSEVLKVTAVAVNSHCIWPCPARMQPWNSTVSPVS